MSTTQWIKSSHSGGEGGQCIEWAPTHVVTHDIVPIRDSKTPNGPTLAISPLSFTAFVRHVRAGGL